MVKFSATLIVGFRDATQICFFVAVLTASRLLVHIPWPPNSTPRHPKPRISALHLRFYTRLLH